MSRKIVKWSPPYRGENVERPTFDLVDLEKDGVIGRIILNAPEKRNPLGYERLLQIEMAAKEMELDDDIRVIIIKGAGPSFSGGYDITPTPPGEPKRNTPENGYHHPDRDGPWSSYDYEHLRVYTTLFDLQKPVIAQIHGACLAGGSELAAFCDLRIVADDAKIGWPVGRNWSPGNLQISPWLMGMTRAKYYMFTSDPITGKQAAEWAWATESVSADELEARTEAVAAKIALTPTDLIMLTKRSINRQFEIMGLKTGMQASADHLAIALLRPGFARGDEFSRRAARDGLKAALAWREKEFGNAPREGAGGAPPSADGPAGDGPKYGG
ncbi:MAG: enoyl-CoA hydratase/isomerase family protein [Alphaproteobacteria bacterium]|nr:enoyl-CoA hydratase/isomerase family protein [Alphaproteobacteria bacterium]